MSKNINGIATRNDCNTIANNAFSNELNKCVTKNDLSLTKRLTINPSEKDKYTDKQLVKYYDIIPSYIKIYYNGVENKDIIISRGYSEGALEIRISSTSSPITITYDSNSDIQIISPLSGEELIGYNNYHVIKWRVSTPDKYHSIMFTLNNTDGVEENFYFTID